MDASAEGRSVFISYTGDQPVVAISQAIEDRGFSPFSSFDVPAGHSHLSALQEALGRAQFAVFLIGGQDEALNASVELGVALAVGLPLLIVADHDVQLPEVAAGLPVVRSELGDRVVLNAALGAIQDLARPDDDPAEAAKSPTLGHRSTDLLARIDRLSGEPRCIDGRRTGLPEVDAQEILATAFREADLRVVAEPSGQFSRADFVVWDKSLEPFMAAPLLVEVVGGGWSLRRLDLKIRQLDEYVRQLPPGRWAMLVLSEDPVDPESLRDLVAEHRVLVIGLPALLERMRDERFADVVRMLRNQRVHS